MESPVVGLKEVASSGRVLPVVSGHMPALDGIRGMAILLVILCHCGAVQSSTGAAASVFHRIMTAGWTGVDLFFVLSGFLITGILLDTKEAENYFTSFYMRRAVRILPLSYATFLVMFDLNPLLGKLGLPHLAQTFSAGQLWYWFYGANWLTISGHMNGYLAHFWSLCVEEQFYLVWPWLVFLTSRRTLAKICLALPLISLLARFTFQIIGVNESATAFLTITRFDGLPLGALAALLVRDAELLGRFRAYRRYFIFIPLEIIGFLVLVTRGFEMSGWALVFGVLPVAVFFATILLLSIPGEGANSALQRFFSMAWLRSCGKYSYAMYIFHLPVLLLYMFHGAGRWAYLRSLSSAGYILSALIHFIVLSLLSYGLARLSWWALEGRANGLKRHFEARFDGRGFRGTDAIDYPGCRGVGGGTA